MRPVGLDRATFDRLAAADGILVSIYLPTQVQGGGIEQGRIRLKNSLGDTEAALEAIGWKPRERADRLSQVGELLEDVEFWQHQGRGLAVFVDEEGKSTSVALSTGTEERVVVANSFHLRPLIPSLEPVELPVLALTMKGVRLYRASRYEAREVAADLPRSIDDVNWFVDREKQSQQHADRAGRKGLRHGHEPAQSHHEDLSRFLRAVEEAIPASNRLEALIVLGDIDLVARFGQISDREILAGGHIADVDNSDDVREAAVPVLKDHEEARMNEIIDMARAHLGKGSAITNLTEALGAAVSGRVDRLLLNMESEPVWGRFDLSTLGVTVDGEQRPLLVDLYDRLVVHAMGTGAEVAATSDLIDSHNFVAIPRF